MNTLRAEGLIKQFGKKRVVDNISIELCQGEVVGLLGPNGAGKTTTFYMIVGLYHPDNGSVFLNGNNITELPMYERARRGITYLPQETSIFRKLTVEENILAILETLPISREQMLRRLPSHLQELNIAHLAKRKAYFLSGGERRRVEITRALVTAPHFILFDEPFTGIDPIAVQDIQQIIMKLTARGIGVLISDHNVRETLNICHRAYIVHDGRILEEGTPERIIESDRARSVYLGENFSM
ncbi:MAG: LPS export ABC transporter ATP-binding protein [Desulfobacterota bacterium]|nr:LPS export ABC transporter ATP-binding protein [Thermodesulfobacteriota bacterium]